MWLWQVVLLVGVYHLAVRLGLSVAYMQSNTSPIWPPTGIALAALLLFGASRWPGVTFGVLLGSLQTGGPFDLARRNVDRQHTPSACGRLRSPTIC